ncbi:Ferric iron reductase protein FhuF, involved in iron transport [Mesobacillus persicus]|uniref:Ferric iron reductase protein FhuF, involved in iron transport n=1 Tax=Mesobacillus persicus TaxID=930146 RepID=A0A1H7ZZK1_9BACI|nr:IucA/IucC family C-terminal-domain containing protein [Mesobacillus persicus]SEM62939.1 Ferric iron reductase protein FhuF, involved in iron transport [Mesobacillus persicus]
MHVKLTKEEAVELSRFRYTPVIDQISSTVPLASLVKKNEMNDFLKDVQVEIQAPDVKVAASVFMKRFAFVAVIYLYALSHWNKRLHFSLDTLYLQRSHKEGNWLPEYYFEDLLAEEFPGENWTEWRRKALQDLFKDIIYPVLNALANEAKISKYTLWENLSVYIFWLYEKILVDEEGFSCRDDYDYIINQAPGKLFGPYHRNPLNRFNEEPVLLTELDEMVRIRKTCCFTYQLGAKRTYCKTCPLYCKQFNTGKRN